MSTLGFKRIESPHNRSCVPLAISLATGLPYETVRADLNRLTRSMTGGLERGVSKGCYPPVYHAFLTRLGWKAYRDADSYLGDSLTPADRCIAVTSNHLCYIEEDVVHDTWDSRYSNRTRCGLPKLLGWYVP